MNTQSTKGDYFLSGLTLVAGAFFAVWGFLGTQWAWGFLIMFLFGLFFWCVWRQMMDSYSYDKFYNSYTPPEKYRESNREYWSKPTVFDTKKEDAPVRPSKSLPPADAEYGE